MLCSLARYTATYSMGGHKISLHEYVRKLKRREGRIGDHWHLDEVFIRINGQQQFLWRAVDQDGDVIDILVQPRRDQRAAVRFFRTLSTIPVSTTKLPSSRINSA